jgi:hypothetical protein
VTDPGCIVSKRVLLRGFGRPTLRQQQRARIALPLGVADW